ncbi:MAG: ATP synthase F1 subunit gamma [Candidatus Riflebacteria bacterium]|jgi:F-type H+-transporting ATPase subunit gamma|nr:ATP synthase F1 subunit gamma [Candidatus Riflebacteria bacterium]
MASLRDIRQKIKGVSSTGQITNAMKMMSTARLNRAIDLLKQSKVYSNKLSAMFHNIKRHITPSKHRCLSKEEIKVSCIIVIGGERGLCGGFNQDLHRFAYETIKNNRTKEIKLVTIGKKVSVFFSKTDIKPYRKIHDLNIKEAKDSLHDLCNELISLYLDKKIDEIRVVYTSFTSATKKSLTQQCLLPLTDEGNLFSKNESSNIEFEFNPSPDFIFENLLPKYIQTTLFRFLLESNAAEQSSRMTAMTSATDRAEEIVDDLKLQLNRSRQALITQEISEVISGSQI